LVKIGSTGEAANRPLDNGDPWSIKSNTVENWLTVCGLEKVKRSAVAVPAFDLVNEGATDKKNTAFDIYKTWFELDTSVEGASPECKIDKYEVVAKTSSGTFVPLGNLDGQTNYKLAEIDSLTPESDFIVNMKYAVAAETVYL
jgi:hypothetical protein